MTKPQDEPQQVPDVEAAGPEYDPAGDFNYDEAHGAGDHEDVPAGLVEEAQRRRTISPR